MRSLLSSSVILHQCHSGLEIIKCVLLDKIKPALNEITSQKQYRTY
uniref:Uncharacterized protein n=1 Tax=Lepeophtheirus salmonis TaxID=72036 RepID=A0A0K2TN97_LEPSM